MGKKLNECKVLIEFESCFFFVYRKPAVEGNPIKGFKPVQPNEFNFLNITKDGLQLGVSPNGQNFKFIDNFISEAKYLVEKHGDAPIKTHIQRICETFEISNGNNFYKKLLSELH